MGKALALVACAVALALAACSSSSSSSSKSSSTTAPADTTPATTIAASGPRSVGHVFVINLENEDYNATWGPGSQAHYLNGTLVPQGKLLTQYFAIGHASLDNYIAEISGQSPNPATQGDCIIYTEFTGKNTGQYGQAVGSGCVYPRTVATIADQLSLAGKTWHGYMEDMGQPCRHPALGAHDDTIVPHAGDMYATRHNPFVYFHSIIDSPACASNVVDLVSLDVDLQSVETTPNFSFITPNVCHDGHDEPCVDGEPGGLVSADQFLSQLVPKILDSPAFKADGLLIITVDEGEITNSAACCNTPPAPNTEKPGLSGPGGGRIGTLLISPRVRANTIDSTPYNHYSLLCSLENIFGLKHLGFAGAPGLACFGRDVYDVP